MSEFRDLRLKLENEWVPAAQRLLEIATARIPVLWDCDFLLGEKDHNGEDTYILCEINVSSVAPYLESAVPYVVDATALTKYNWIEKTITSTLITLGYLLWNAGRAILLSTYAH
jgi:hypothetical protein